MQPSLSSLALLILLQCVHVVCDAKLSEERENMTRTRGGGMKYAEL